jgi:hypothetical protein
MNEILRGQNTQSFVAKLLLLLYRMFLLFIAREVWWMNQE